MSGEGKKGTPLAPLLILPHRSGDKERAEMIEHLRRGAAKYLEIGIKEVERENGRPFQQVYQITHIDSAGVWGFEVERA